MLELQLERVVTGLSPTQRACPGGPDPGNLPVTFRGLFGDKSQTSAPEVTRELGIQTCLPDVSRSEI